MGMRLGMTLIAGTLAIGLGHGALAQDTTASYGKDGVSLTAGDAFSFKMSTNLQVRATLNDNRDNGSGTSVGDDMSFSIARMKTTFQGNVFDKKWSYKAIYAWHSNTLEAARVSYARDDLYTVNFGADKLNFNMQETTSSSAQQFVDRSTANEEFNLDYATGAWLSGKSKFDAHTFRYSLGIHNGAGGYMQSDRANAGTVNNAFNMMYAGRLELLVNSSDGDAITKGESDLRSDADRGGMQAIIGMGFAWNDLDRSETPNLGGAGPYNADVYSLVWDARVHCSGFSVNAGVFHRTVNYSDDADTDAAHANGWTDMGFYGQLGYNMHCDCGAIEPALRYSFNDRDDFNSGGVQTDNSELTAAVNMRSNGDRLKLTLEATYMEASDHGGGVNPTHPGVQYRLQLQLGF